MRSELVAVVCLAAVLSAACTGSSGPTSAATAAEAPAPAVVPSPDPGPAAAAGETPPSVPSRAPVEDTVASPPPSPDPQGDTAPTVAFRTETRETEGYTVTATLPVVTGVAADVASAIEDQLAAWFAAQVAGFERDERDFRLPDEDLEGFPPGWLEIRSTTGARTSALLSVVLTVEAMHQGMAHPWTVVEAFTYDLTTGAPVTLTELFAPGQDVLGAVSAGVVPVLVDRLDPEGSGWAEAGVREGAGADADLLRRFAVDADGLTVHFDQYQVAPGAAGVQQVTLGWDALLGVLTPSDALRRALDAGV